MSCFSFAREMAISFSREMAISLALGLDFGRGLGLGDDLPNMGDDLALAVPNMGF